MFPLLALRAGVGCVLDAHRGHAETEGGGSSMVSINPDYQAQAAVERGRRNAEQGRITVALADFAEAIRLAPHLAEAYFERGKLHLDRERFKDALADLSAALERRPGWARALSLR